jgi:hypothetical protein
MQFFKLLLVLCLLSFPSNIIFARSMQDVNVCNISSKGTIYITKDLGVLPPDSQSVETTFTWKNTSQQDLKIDKILKNCVCLLVSPEEGNVPQDQTIAFKAKADVKSWYGNSTIKFTVLFKDYNERVTFTANFFRKVSLTPSPKNLDFGRINFPLQSRNLFKVVWAVPPDQNSVEFYPNSFSEKGLASCRLITDKQYQTRNPSVESSQSIKQEFMFEAYLNPDLPRGEFKDILKIPVKLNGDISYVMVPLAGFFPGKIFPNSTSFFWTVKDHNEKAKITLFRQNWCKEQKNLLIRCDDSRLVITTKTLNGSSVNEATIPIVEIELGINKPEMKIQNINTEIKVEYEIGAEKDSFIVPIKVLFLDNIS